MTAAPSPVPASDVSAIGRGEECRLSDGHQQSEEHEDPTHVVPPTRTTSYGWPFDGNPARGQRRDRRRPARARPLSPVSSDQRRGTGSRSRRRQKHGFEIPGSGSGPRSARRVRRVSGISRGRSPSRSWPTCSPSASPTPPPGPHAPAAPGTATRPNEGMILSRALHAELRGADRRHFGVRCLGRSRARRRTITRRWRWGSPTTALLG